jgi:hypothetical protein
MPKVRKSLFYSNYTNNKLTIFNVFLIEVTDLISYKNNNNKPVRVIISTLTLSILLDYVLVKAEEERVVDCYSLKAEH